MRPPNARFFKPTAGQIHGDPNFKANRFNQQILEELNACSIKYQFTKWLKNKGIGLVQNVAGQVPGTSRKDKT